MRNIILALAIAFAVAACSHNLREELDLSLTKYNDLLSRNELGPASIFAASSVKEEFIARATALKDIRIIDYRIVNAKYIEGQKQASVEVEISYYNLYYNKVKSLRYLQDWIFSEEKGVNGWRLISVPPEFK